MENTTNIEKFGTEKISKLIMRFAIPSVIGMLVNALYNIVDRIFVGQMVGNGSTALAAIAITFPLTTLIIAFAGLIRMGATSMVALKRGEGMYDEADRITNMAFTMFIIMGIVYTILILIFLEPLLLLIGASKETLPYAKDYMQIIAYGALFQFVGFGMNNFLTTDGHPKTAMFTMIIGGVLNVILDPILIYGFNMGIQGAAIATSFSQAVAAVWVIAYFFTKKSAVRLTIKKMKLKLMVVWRMCVMGMPMFMTQIATSVIVSALNVQLIAYGTDLHVTAFGIIMSLSQFTVLPVIGIAHGAQPIFGYNYGARNFNRVLKAYKFSVFMATGYILVVYAGFMIFPQIFIRMFTDPSPALLDFNMRAIRVFLLFEPLAGFEIISTNYFQSIGEPGKSLWLSILRQGLVLIPLLIILPSFIGLEGVLISMPIAEIIATILTAILMIHSVRKLRQMQKTQDNLEKKVLGQTH